MSRNEYLQQEIQAAILSVNPVTALPYPADWEQVADGQGTRRWQSIFATISSQSSTDGYPLDYLPSTLSTVTINTQLYSTIVATSFSTLSTQIGEGGIPGSITTYQLQSTVRWVQQDSKYISTADLVSSMTPFLDGSLSFMSNIQSTVIGLGSARYISSPQLLSTTTGLRGETRSTVVGLGSAGYVSTLSLQSTVRNLGTAGYISSTALVSTVQGLLYPPASNGSLGVVVTGSTDPPYQNYTTLTDTYLATNQYFNTSNAGSYGVVYGSNLPSTTLGLISSLGSYGYISTPALLSTSAGILAAKQNVYIDRSGAVSIYNSQIAISSVAAITFLSSFVNSTINYKGQNGAQFGSVTADSNLIFSTASLQLDAFSSFITADSRITAELYPTFEFPPITTGALTSKTFTMSTLIQYSTATLSTFHTTLVAGTSATSGFSNYFQQPLKLTFPGSLVLGNYHEPYVLRHEISGGLSYALNVGFRDSNLNVFYGSTNSLFLSVQNLTF